MTKPALIKLVTALLAAGFLWSACERKDDPVPDPKPDPTPARTDLHLSLSPTVLSGGPVWKVAPQVRLYKGPGEWVTLSRGSDGLYSGDNVYEGGEYLVLSPDAPSNCDGTHIQVSFPSHLWATAIAVPDSVAFAVGRGEETSLTLEPLFSGLMLSFMRADVKAVTLRSAAGEQLSGKVRFTLPGRQAEPQEGGDHVRYEPSFGWLTAGEKWIVTLPPVNLSQGLVLTVETDEGTYDWAYDEAFNLAIGRFLSLTVPDGLPDNPPAKEGMRTMYITTPGNREITSKDYWTENCTVKIVDGSGNVDYENNAVSVKGRGNSTWNYDKKPYAIKLPAKADLLGGDKADKRWVLLANWMDRTLLRNEIAFEIARRCSGLEWTPHGEFVELYLNGRHRGNYWLGEKIKTGKARLEADYLIEMDTYYDAVWRFYSSYGFRVNQWQYGMPIGVKEPDDDEMTQELFQTLKTLVDDVEKAIYLGTGSWQEKIDIPSWVDWYFVHELTWNAEPNHPKSCYFYFRNGVMYAGPVWDFDWYTFQPGKSGLAIGRSIYFEKLLEKPEFVEALKARWAALKPMLSDINDYIDTKADEIRESESANWAMWPCTSSYVNGDERMSFDQAIKRMKNAMTERISTLDRAISEL